MSAADVANGAFFGSRGAVVATPELLGSGLSVETDTISDPAWASVLAEFADPHYEQTPSFIGGQRGERASHLLLRKAGSPVAGARLAIYRLPGWPQGLALIRLGPFWRRSDRPADPATYRAVISALVEEYCVRRGHCLTIRPRPNPEFFDQECAILKEFGFVERRKIPAPERYLVDASLDEGAQMKSLEQKWRYNLRQALPHGFDVRLCETDDDVATFHALYERMASRKNFGHAGMFKATGELMRLPESIRMRLVLASLNGKPLVGATVGVLGDTAYYVHGASDDEALPLKAGYALQWWILSWLRGLEARWYDLGGSLQNEGLRQFKKGLTGKRGATVSMREFDTWAKPGGRIAGDLIYKLRDAKARFENWRRGRSPRS